MAKIKKIPIFDRNYIKDKYIEDLLEHHRKKLVNWSQRELWKAMYEGEWTATTSTETPKKNSLSELPSIPLENLESGVLYTLIEDRNYDEYRYKHYTTPDLYNEKNVFKYKVYIRKVTKNNLFLKIINRNNYIEDEFRIHTSYIGFAYKFRYKL